MSSLAKNMKTLAAVVGFAAAGVATGAQAAPLCGIYGVAGGTAPTVYYDPFEPAGLQSMTITMSITRINPPGGGKTSDINFYLESSSNPPSEANGIQIIPRTFSGQGSMTGAGLNIFYDYPVNPPNYSIGSVPSSGNRYLQVEFNGNPGQADTVQITFDVIMPANLNLNASRTLSFDAVFSCKLQGGQYNNKTDGGRTPNAITFPVTILSAMRASYVGTALDFGEIGAIPATPPAPVRTNPANHVLVLSSGAYQVQLTSQNGYKMKRSGAATINDEVRYSLKFLGDTRSPSDTSEINHTCIRAGIASAGQQLPIQATLIDGGAGKNPATDYNDQLTVTVTPLAYDTVASENCGGYTL